MCAIMTKITKRFGVRGDLHGRLDKAKLHEAAVRLNLIDGIFDVGDIEAKYIGREHPLRKDQHRTGERTMDAIVRNALTSEGEVTEEGISAIEDTLRTVEEVRDYLNDSEILQRVIQGNARESWEHVFSVIADADQQAALKALFDSYTTIIRDATAEFYVEGELRKEGNQNGIALLYLPWKASLDTVDEALMKIESSDPSRVIVFSHDYLTRRSLHPDYRESVKPMQNEEQVVEVLDRLSQTGAKVIGFYGHIGFCYNHTRVQFKHSGKTITAIHVDERSGELHRFDLEG